MTYFVSPANLQAMEQGLVIGKAEVVGATFNQAQYGGTGGVRRVGARSTRLRLQIDAV